MLKELLYFLICLFATTVGATSGLGGGIIIKPMMDALSGLSVSTISFLSGTTLLAMSTVSLLSSRKSGIKVDKTRGTLLAIGAAVGGVAGKQVFNLLKSAAANDGLIGVIQSAFMIVLTLGVLAYMLNKKRIRTHSVQSPAVCALIGLVLGMLSAFLGIGGGPINMMVLYYLFSMDTKTAALNSIYIIFFAQLTSLLSTLILRKVPDFAWTTLIVMGIGGVAGGLIGRKLAHRLSVRHTDLLFNTMLIVITGICLYNLVRYAAI